MGDKDGDGEVGLPELEMFFGNALFKGQIKATLEVMDTDKDGKLSIQELEDFIFKTPSPEDIEKYNQLMADSPIECFEKVQPESVVAAGCIAYGWYSGVSCFGFLACLAGAGAIAYRLSKTQEGKDFVVAHTSMKKEPS